MQQLTDLPYHEGCEKLQRSIICFPLEIKNNR